MLNSVSLVGRLTKDIELKYTPSGVAVATMTLAVNRTFSNQQGEREADFINVVVWRKPAENAANYLHKGSLAGVTGRLQTRTYDGNDGKKVYVTEVVADNVAFLDSKKDGSSQQSNQQSTNHQKKEAQKNLYSDPFANGGGTIDIQDDDLPF